CPVSAILASYLPDYARDAHGNLAAQTRAVGATRGVDTSKPSLNAPAPPPPNPAMTLATKHNCMACHRVEGKLLGPSFKEIAGRYAGKGDAMTTLSARIMSGGAGNWGQIPMPPNPNVGEHDLSALVKWILSGGS
ncbi:MAG: c-type cytochrome, partial [Betaproteobacteria bacterium]|nr:c-type cytochrome [Betaproteobacteria bacterium]